jgi:hypothetical protein
MSAMTTQTPPASPDPIPDLRPRFPPHLWKSLLRMFLVTLLLVVASTLIAAYRVASALSTDPPSASAQYLHAGRIATPVSSQLSLRCEGACARQWWLLPDPWKGTNLEYLTDEHDRCMASCATGELDATCFAETGSESDCARAGRGLNPPRGRAPTAEEEAELVSELDATPSWWRRQRLSEILWTSPIYPADLDDPIALVLSVPTTERVSRLNDLYNQVDRLSNLDGASCRNAFAAAALLPRRSQAEKFLSDCSAASTLIKPPATGTAWDALLALQLERAARRDHIAESPLHRRAIAILLRR